jgi:hypothetical protein
MLAPHRPSRSCQFGKTPTEVRKEWLRVKSACGINSTVTDSALECRMATRRAHCYRFLTFLGWKRGSASPRASTPAAARRAIFANRRGADVAGVARLDEDDADVHGIVDSTAGRDTCLRPPTEGSYGDDSG